MTDFGTGQDIELFVDEAPADCHDGEIDLFIDDDFDFSADDDDDLGGLDPEAILCAAQEFKDLFAGDGLELSSSTAALSLFQSLQSIGFKCQIDMTDTHVSIEAASDDASKSDMLLEAVESILEGLYHIATLHSESAAFVVRKVSCHMEDDGCVARIDIVSTH